MRDEFEALIAGGEEAIKSLVRERHQESVTLEFKVKEDPSRGDYSTNDKQQLAKELSAFSNSMGGLLIWGVRAAKDAEGVDCASSLHPITELERFKNQSIRLSAELLSPKNEQIQMQGVRSSENRDSGFLIISVGRSERRPHRSEAKGQKLYFKRAGDSAYAMEHFDIEDAFKRQSVASLSLSLHFQKRISSGRQALIEVLLVLKNTSGISARHPYMNYRQLSGVLPNIPANYTMAGSPGFSRRHHDGWLCHNGSADDVIHPSQSTVATALYAIIDRDQSDQWVVRDPQSLLDGIRFSYQIGSLDARVDSGIFELGFDDVRQQLIELGYDFIGK